MITMQRPGETSIQSFSLPLTPLANPTESRKSDLRGLPDIIIKYRQSKLVIPQTHRVHGNTADVNTQVCLAIEVVRACGLKVYCIYYTSMLGKIRNACPDNLEDFT